MKIRKPKQGDLNQTGNPTDLALLQGVLPEGEDGAQGSLFFTVTGDDGAVRYTRNGQFTVDGAGMLTTAAGHRVLDTDGNEIEVGSTFFNVNENGVISSSEGEILGQVGVVYVANPLELRREGSGLLAYDGEEAEGGCELKKEEEARVNAESRGCELEKGAYLCFTILIESRKLRSTKWSTCDRYDRLSSV